MDFNGLPLLPLSENFLVDVILVTIVILAVWKAVEIILWIANHVTFTIN